MVDFIFRGGKDIVFSDFSLIWKFQRKIVYFVFKMFGLGIKLIEEKVCQEIDEFMICFENVEGCVYDFQDDIVLVVINIICVFVFGFCYDLDDFEFYIIFCYNYQFV